MGYKVSSLIQDPHPYGVPTHGTRPNDPGPSIVLHPLFRGDFIRNSLASDMPGRLSPREAGVKDKRPNLL
jgi:hypothetical protein